MTNTDDRLREQAREHLLNGKEGDYIEAENGSLVEVVDWFGGRYAMYYNHEFCGVTEEVDRAVDFLCGPEEPCTVTLYGVEVSVDALKTVLRRACRDSLMNPFREYLVMLNRNSGSLWWCDRKIGDKHIPQLYCCTPLYAFCDYGEDILEGWYWGNLYDSEKNEAVEAYTDPETWASFKADAEKYDCEPWELALEDRDIRLHFRNEAADAFLDDYDGRETLDCVYDIIIEEADDWARRAAR